MNVTPRTQDASRVGQFLRYSTGPLAGRSIRSELHEYQKPDLGRKFARRDRRPLDPPPIIRLRLFERFDEGLPTEHEEEIPADEIDVAGLVAHIDLFPLPSTTVKDGPLPSVDTNEEESLATTTTGSTSPAGIDAEHPATAALFGSSFVHAVHMDWRGEPVIFFVFSDLSIRLDGHFCLRYRTFDLFSRTDVSDHQVPIAAELWSGTFVVYSSKDFPGLQASTQLTKHLSRWGVRVNLREKEQKRTTADSDGDDDEPHRP